MTGKEAQVFGEWCRSENNIRKERLIRRVFDKMVEIELRNFSDLWKNTARAAIEANFMSKYIK
jgi:hypothetical protein